MGGGAQPPLRFPLPPAIPLHEPKKGAGLGPPLPPSPSLTEVGPLPYLLSFQLALCSPFLKALRGEEEEGWLEARARPQLCRPELQLHSPRAPRSPPCIRTGSGALEAHLWQRTHLLLPKGQGAINLTGAICRGPPSFPGYELAPFTAH